MAQRHIDWGCSDDTNFGIVWALKISQIAEENDKSGRLLGWTWNHRHNHIELVFEHEVIVFESGWYEVSRRPFFTPEDYNGYQDPQSQRMVPPGTPGGQEVLSLLSYKDCIGGEHLDLG